MVIAVIVVCVVVLLLFGFLYDRRDRRKGRQRVSDAALHRARREDRRDARTMGRAGSGDPKSWTDYGRR